MTTLLRELPGADRSTRKVILDQVVTLLADQLREQARNRMANEPAKHLLQATALVNELYLKLLQSQLAFEDRQHFLGLAGRMMRNIIVDEARRFRSAKRWGQQHVTALDYKDVAVAMEMDPDSILTLHSAMDSLEQPEVELVELRYFYGLTLEETAEAMGIEYETLRKRWSRVRRKLYRNLTGAERDESH